MSQQRGSTMLQPGRTCRMGRFGALALVAVLALGAALVQPARAADSAKLDTSLKFIPEDAAFYASMLRNREQLQTILNSRAWATLKELPAVQQALKKLQ